jgi:hypothetical protein
MMLIVLYRLSLRVGGAGVVECINGGRAMWTFFLVSPFCAEHNGGRAVVML